MRIKPTHFAGLVLMTLFWALCFPLILLGLPFAPPLAFAGLRSLLSGALFLIPAFALRRPMPRSRGEWLRLGAAGIGAASFGFLGMFLAAESVSPGIATVLANIQPLIAAGLAYFYLDEKLGLRRGFGMLVAFIGILLIAFPGFSESHDSSLTGVLLIFFGAIGVAIGNIFIKSLAGKVDWQMVIGWQFLIGSAPLFLLSILFETPITIDWSISFALVLVSLSLLGTALPFGLWFFYLRCYELNRINTFTFLTTVFGLLLGTLFFGENLGLLEYAASLWSPLGSCV
jgi:drug/metabolite transporter (DMT)-like permease